MKQIQQLIEICKPSDSNFRFDKTNLTREQQVQVEEILIEHFQLKKIIWSDYPSGLTENGKPYVARTFKLGGENPKQNFETMGYLWQICFSQRIYPTKPASKDYKILDEIEAVKGIAYPAFLVENEEGNSEMYSEIRLRFDIEKERDLSLTVFNKIKLATDAVSKIIRNPEEYFPGGKRTCFIRIAIEKI